MTSPTTPTILLRPVIIDDLPTLFEQQRDPEANHMAAFTSADPHNREAYMARWSRLVAEPSVTMQAIVVEGVLVGSVLVYGEPGEREVSYWLGREFWGRGYATAALRLFIEALGERPLFARVVKDNVGSLRVLEKCGFVVVGDDRGYANARGAEVEEWVLRRE